MMPDKCSVSEEGKQCVNPPQFIVSIVDGKDEYMFGLTCQKHRHIVSGKLTILQNEGKMHSGKISFTPVKSVGTCLLYTSPSPRDATLSRMPSSA